MDNYTGIREIARQYLYYWMGMDIVAGLVLSRLYPAKQGNDQPEDPDNWRDHGNGKAHDDTKGNYESTKGNYESTKGNYESTKGNYESTKGNYEPVEPAEPVERTKDTLVIKATKEPEPSDPMARKPQDQACENGICEVTKKSIFTKSEDSGESATSNSDHVVKANRSKSTKKPTKIVYVQKKDTETDANPMDTEIPVYNKAT
jgi:hypothetical protein